MSCYEAQANLNLTVLLLSRAHACWHCKPGSYSVPSSVAGPWEARQVGGSELLSWSNLGGRGKMSNRKDGVPHCCPQKRSSIQPVTPEADKCSTEGLSHPHKWPAPSPPAGTSFKAESRPTSFLHPSVLASSHHKGCRGCWPVPGQLHTVPAEQWRWMETPQEMAG